jgi:hypothetical protein
LETNCGHVRQTCPLCYNSFRADVLTVCIKDNENGNRDICWQCIEELTPEYGKLIERLYGEYEALEKKDDNSIGDVLEYVDQRLKELDGELI